MSHHSVLGRVSAGETLSLEEMRTVIDQIMAGEWSDADLALLLTALHTRGETPAEVAGAALALRQHMTPIRSARSGLLDTCGTGGDGSGTFNISTAAALVAAAAGAPVAKHGNRKITSKTGSADVLAALGVNIDATPEVVAQCLDRLGICFCFAPQLHPAMKRVAQVRRGLGHPSIFNLLGPLSNPAEAEYQLLGVGNANLRQTLGEALRLLPVKRAVVVCGRDGMDEVSLSSETDVSEIRGDGLRELVWSPEDFGLARASNESMLVDSPEESADRIRAILAGEAGPSRDIVVLNAAAGLWAAEVEEAPAACAARAAGAIDSGRARDLLAELAEASHS